MQSTVGQKNTYGRGQRAVGRGNKLTRKTNTKAKAMIKANLKKKKKFQGYKLPGNCRRLPLEGLWGGSVWQACSRRSCSRFYTAWMHSEPVSDASQVPFSSCLTYIVRSVDIFEVNSHLYAKHRQNYRIALLKVRKEVRIGGENWRKTFSWYMEQQKYNVYAVLNRNQRRFFFAHQFLVSTYGNVGNGKVERWKNYAVTGQSF